MSSRKRQRNQPGAQTPVPPKFQGRAPRNQEEDRQVKPLTAKWFSLLVFFLFLGMGGVVATQIHHRSLEQVLKPNSLVLEATLVKSSKHRSQMWETYEFELTEAQFLVGPQSEVQRATLSNPMPHCRSVDGVARRVSPLQDANGLESELAVGDRYLFIAQVEPKDGCLDIVRVEPTERATVIKALLEKLRKLH